MVFKTWEYQRTFPWCNYKILSQVLALIFALLFQCISNVDTAFYFSTIFFVFCILFLFACFFCFCICSAQYFSTS